MFPFLIACYHMGPDEHDNSTDDVLVVADPLTGDLVSAHLFGGRSWQTTTLNVRVRSTDGMLYYTAA